MACLACSTCSAGTDSSFYGTGGHNHQSSRNLHVLSGLVLASKVGQRILREANLGDRVTTVLEDCGATGQLGPDCPKQLVDGVDPDPGK